MKARRMRFEGDPIDIILIEDKGLATKVVSALTKSKARVLGLDIETCPKKGFEHDVAAGLCPYRSEIRLIQVYDYTSGRAYIFDVLKIDVSLKILLTKAFRSKRFAAHNAIFEMQHFAKRGIYFKTLDCTLILANIIWHAEDGTDKQLQSSLKKVVAQELGYDIPKEMQISDWSRDKLTQDQIVYAAIDAYIVVKLWQKYVPRIKKHGLGRVYKLNRVAQRVVVDMQLAGIHMDRKLHKKLIKKWEAQELAAYGKVRKILGGVNPRSGKQMTEWLTKHLPKDELEKWPKTPSGKGLSTNADTLSRFEHLDFVKPLVEYNDVRKLCNTYGRSLWEKVNPVTGRLHGQYNLARAQTGRGSSSNPNLQNFLSGPEFRSLFISAPGKKLLCADYSQMEMRVMAELSQDPVLLKAFRNGKDLHAIMGAALTGIPPKQVVANKDVDGSPEKNARKLGKVINLAKQYGMGAEKLQFQVYKFLGKEISLSEAEQYSKTYDMLYETLTKWKYKQGEVCGKTLYATTPLGKLRRLHPERYFCQGINHPDQGGSAEIMLTALVDLRKEIRRKKLDAKILLQVHDEIVVEVGEGEVSEVSKVLHDTMVGAAVKIFPNICTKGMIDVHVGNTWAEAKG